jgi:hypothetical protein
MTYRRVFQSRTPAPLLPDITLALPMPATKPPRTDSGGGGGSAVLQTETVVYATAGTYTPTVPTWATRCEVVLYGSGGPGGDDGGSGGGAGQYLADAFAIVAGDVIEVEVGAAYTGTDTSPGFTRVSKNSVVIAEAVPGIFGTSDFADESSWEFFEGAQSQTGIREQLDGLDIEVTGIGYGFNPGGGGGWSEYTFDRLIGGSAGNGIWSGTLLAGGDNSAGLSRASDAAGGGSGGSGGASGVNGYTGGSPGGGGGGGAPGMSGGAGGAGRATITFLGAESVA